MTKRLGMFLGLGFAGVLLLLTGLAWDAFLHANDPSLAGREGIFTLSNPGHALLGLGIGLVLVSLIGGCDTVLASARSGWWARPAVRQGFLAASTAVVVMAAGVTSWAAQAGHEHPAVSAAHGHDAGSALAAVTGVAHDHADAADLASDAADAGAAGHDHAGAADGAAGAAHEGHTATSVVHDHLADGASPSAAAADAGAHAPHGTAASGPAAPSGHDHGGSPADGPGAGDHHAGPSEPAGGAEADAPAGTWTEVRYGPFALPPAGAGGDADHADIALPSLQKPCTNCFLLGIEPDLVYADGTSANLDTGMMLHHAVLFAAGRPDATCGPDQPFPGKLGQRFFASGNERTSGQLPPGFGYYVDNGNWSGLFHVMNHSSVPKTVWFRMKVRWSPAAAGGVRPVTPIWLDMNNCQTSEYKVPAGPSSSHWTWTSNLTGRIVSTGGHVHNGGIRTTLTNQTTGDQICTSWAGWGRKAAYQGSIESMSVCSWDRVGTVKKGEVLDLESVYDAPQPVPDAMGIMMAFVYETADLAGGTPAPPDVRGAGPGPVESTPPPSTGHDHH